MDQESRRHKIWTEQCDAARSIRLHYGVEAAFDYLVGEKLMTFADAAMTRPEFKNDLPYFISVIRTIFSMRELEIEVARIEQRLRQDKGWAVRHEELDVVSVESQKSILRRNERFTILKSLLTAPQLGTA